MLSWLKELIAESNNEMLADLVQLALTMLQTDPNNRPTAVQISEDLPLLGVRAHFRAVQDAFALYLHNAKQQGESGPPVMRVWFEKERLNALGTILGFRGET